jgi:hypothetical protein
MGIGKKIKNKNKFEKKINVTERQTRCDVLPVRFCGTNRTGARNA